MRNRSSGEVRFSKEEFTKKLNEKAGFFVSDLTGLITGELPNFEKIKKIFLRKIFYCVAESQRLSDTCQSDEIALPHSVIEITEHQGRDIG